MTAIAELDVVTISVEVEAQLIGEERIVLMPAGSLGAVVHIHLSGAEVVAFEVEFQVGGNSYALATVPTGQVSRATRA